MHKPVTEPGIPLKSPIFGKRSARFKEEVRLGFDWTALVGYDKFDQIVNAYLLMFNFGCRMNYPSVVSCFVIAFLIFGSDASAFAQESRGPEKDKEVSPEKELRPESESSKPLPKAKFVIDNYIKAKGGYELLDSIQNVRLRANAIYQNAPMKYESIHRADGWMAETYSFANGRVSTRVLRGDVGWELFNGTVRQLHGKELKNYLFRNRYPFWCTHWMDDCEKIKCVGIVSVNGNDAYKIHFVMKGGFQFDKYFDVTNFHLVRTVTDMYYRDAIHSNITDVFETKRINGILFEKKQKVTWDAKPSSYDYDEIEVDVKIAKGTFDIPPGVSTDKKKSLPVFGLLPPPPAMREVPRFRVPSTKPPVDEKDKKK